MCERINDVERLGNDVEYPKINDVEKVVYPKIKKVGNDVEKVGYPKIKDVEKWDILKSGWECRGGEQGSHTGDLTLHVLSTKQIGPPLVCHSASHRDIC